MVSRIIASISAALDSLHPRISEDTYCEVMKYKLRVLRTFLLCASKLEVYPRTEDLQLQQNQIKKKKRKKRKLEQDLKLLLVRVEDVVGEILKGKIGDIDNLKGLVDLEEELDRMYSSLFNYFQQYPSSPMAEHIMEMANSILQNFEDVPYTGSSPLVMEKWIYGTPYFPRDWGIEITQAIPNIKKNNFLIRNFFRVSPLFCDDQLQRFQDLLSNIEPLMIRASHLTLHLYPSQHFIDSTKYNYLDKVRSMFSSFFSSISPAENHLIHEAYFQALTSSKYSPGFLMRDKDPLFILEDFISFLLSTLWEMLQVDTTPAIYFQDKLQAMYEGIRSVRILLKKNTHHEKIMDLIIRAILFDAGIIIFSAGQEDFDIDHALQDFLDKVNVIQMELLEDQQNVEASFSFPNTNATGFVDFLLEDYVAEVKIIKADYDTISFVPKIQQQLVYIKLVLGKLVELRSQEEGIHQDIWNRTVYVAHKIERLIDQLVLGKILHSFKASFQSITDDIEIIKSCDMRIFDDKIQEIEIQKNSWASTDQVALEGSSTSKSDEFVGFDTERTIILDRLQRGSKKLQAVAVVGMPGLGKTTLATKVYGHPSVTNHFSARAWCSISQVFDRKRVLIELLSQIQPSGDFTTSASVDDLSQKLWRSLKGRRYLIFMDDVWDIRAFDKLKESLPDDSNQSRILVTSRQAGTVPEAVLIDKPIFPPQFTVDESLELLKRKLFPEQKCWPSALYEFGKEIAACCKGLPLTVVIVAGLLKSTKQEAWKDILEALRSGVISNTDQCIHTIDLSYKHLPEYLKPCFLSFGAYPEDHEFSLKQLIWLWAAEGFAQKTTSMSSEEVAANYLKILMGRSLIMSAKQTSRRAVKACRIHDLLHEFCLRKSREDNFLHAYGDSELLRFDETEHLSCDEKSNLRRLYIHSKVDLFMESKPFLPGLRSLSFFGPSDWANEISLSFIFRMFKLLRVLDLKHIEFDNFPSEIGRLVQLRYLAMKVDDSVSDSIGNLSNLETLIFLSNVGVCLPLPDTFWNLQKLRHLHYVNEFNSCGIELPVDNLESSSDLLHVESLSTLIGDNWDITERQLSKFPNIRQVKCIVDTSKGDPLNGGKAMDLSFLSRLESLSMCLRLKLDRTAFEYIFPENIKKLTLSRCRLPWEKISGIARLPNLVVLKLLKKCFVGDIWNIEEGEFEKLRFLKLNSSDVKNWTAASDDQLPDLEKLVFLSCYKLKEIPECLQNVANLETIEVINCTERLARLVLQVEDYQKDMGNSSLQVRVGEEDSSEDEYSSEDKDDSCSDDEYDSCSDHEDSTEEEDDDQ